MKARKIAALALALRDSNSSNDETPGLDTWITIGLLCGPIAIGILVFLVFFLDRRIKIFRQWWQARRARHDTQLRSAAAAAAAAADIESARSVPVSAKLSRTTTARDLVRAHLFSSVRPPPAAVTAGVGAAHRQQVLNLERTDSQIAHASGSPRILVQQEWFVTAESSTLAGTGMGLGFGSDLNMDLGRDPEMYELHRCLGPSSLRPPPPYEGPVEPLPVYVRVEEEDRRAAGQSGSYGGSAMAPAA